MHRAYQPVLPCGNKYLQLKWDKAKYEEHKKKIQAAKPLVDTSTPATYGHLHLKLGKLKEEPFKKQVSKQDRKREKQLKEKSMRRKMKGVHHGKGRDQLEQDSTPEMAHFPQSPVKCRYTWSHLSVHLIVCVSQETSTEVSLTTAVKNQRDFCKPLKASEQVPFWWLLGKKD
ncbi:uncharacterized protein CFAP97D2 [Apteryx mantelli]|uniref:Uncharacterized protein CFAP97D2 n=1 Tax=Apteryx mantelli TaxID=2696672 RepID=A0ABM4FVA0_9AVES